MKRYIDLHTHSNYSDGTDSPGQLIIKAKEAGLCAIALTDHDAVAGLNELTESGLEHGVETVCGIEISSQMLDIEAHLLGYFISWNNRAMDDYLTLQKASREEKISRTLIKLREIGFDISYEDFHESKGIITRGSIAGVMHKKGFIGYKNEAFEKYIGEGRPAFVDRERVSVTEALELVLECGGIPVLAHPYLYDIDDAVFEAELARLVSAGLKGIEVMYSSKVTGSRELYYRSLAAKYSLLITGGSDYHGDNKTVTLGSVYDNAKVPYELLEKLRAS